jgi:FkbM family methyltransferase
MNSLFSGIAKGAFLTRAIWNHPGNRQRRTRSVARFFAWQAVKHFFKRATIIRFHNQRLKCFPDSTSTSGALYFSGYPDYWEMKFLQAYLRPGDNFLDVGANTGVYSVLASAYIGPTGFIDAFEPTEKSAARIEEQATLNSLHNLRVHRFALCDRQGDLEFGYSNNDATMHLRRPDEPRHAPQIVRGMRLDGFEPYRDYAAGKIDIEGAEPLAFAGAAERLRHANPPVWLLELAGYSTCYGISSDEVVQQLAAAGFECAVFHPDSGALEYTNEPWSLGVQNVLAIASSHRADVEHRLAQSRGDPP